MELGSPIHCYPEMCTPLLLLWLGDDRVNHTLSCERAGHHVDSMIAFNRTRVFKIAF